jgi:small subunit ribosomal protein S24e
MELRVISTKENKTVGRKEIEFSLVAEAGAKRDAIKAELCKKENLDPKATIIISINNSFGSMTSNGIAHSYQSEAALKRYESRHLLQRFGIIPKDNAKSAQPAAAPAAAPVKEAKQS